MRVYAACCLALRLLLCVRVLQGVKIDDACSAAGVRAFPTWLINGRVLEGEFSLEELGAELDKPAEAAQL